MMVEDGMQRLYTTIWIHFIGKCLVIAVFNNFYLAQFNHNITLPFCLRPASTSNVKQFKQASNVEDDSELFQTYLITVVGITLFLILIRLKKYHKKTKNKK